MNGRPGPPAARLEEIAGAVGGTVVGARDTLITGVSSLAEAAPGDIAYIESERFAEAARASRAAAFVVASAVDGLGRATGDRRRAPLRFRPDRRGLLHRSPPGARRRPRGDPRRRRRHRAGAVDLAVRDARQPGPPRRARHALSRRLRRRRGGDRRRHGPAPQCHRARALLHRGPRDRAQRRGDRQRRLRLRAAGRPPSQGAPARDRRDRGRRGAGRQRGHRPRDLRPHAGAARDQGGQPGPDRPQRGDRGAHACSPARPASRAARGSAPT